MPYSVYFINRMNTNKKDEYYELLEITLKLMREICDRSSPSPRMIVSPGMAFSSAALILFT